MATTTPAADQRQTTAPPPAAAGERFAPPPKLRRRPVLLAASVAAVCLGALLSMWAYRSAADTRSVLAARTTIERGDVITADDLVAVNISADPALDPLGSDQAAAVVGRRAALDVPAGGLLTPGQVADTALPADGSSLVGMKLPPGTLPFDLLRVGDAVRVVAAGGDSADLAGDPLSVPAAVAGVSTDDSTGEVLLNVQVPSDAAPALAARAAAGRVAVVLDGGR